MCQGLSHFVLGILYNFILAKIATVLFLEVSCLSVESCHQTYSYHCAVIVIDS